MTDPVVESRDFSTAAIASLSTGVLLCDLSEMHEAAEYLMGHPIWTHHFGSKDLWHKMQRAIIEQHPRMPTAIPNVDSDNYLAHLTRIESEFGEVVKIKKGSGATAMHPFDGIPAAYVTTDGE